MFKHNFSDSQSYLANTNTARGKGCVKSDVQSILNAKYFFKGICSKRCKKKEKVYDLESTNHSSNSSSVRMLVTGT